MLFRSAIDVPAAGEAYSLTFATDAECTDGNVDTGTVVRWTLSNAQIASTLAQSGSTGITLRINGTSPTSARLEYFSNIGGVPISWNIVFYSASPNLGAVVTQVAVRGINVTTRVTSSLSTVAGTSTSSIPAGFIIDRVYSCKDPKGDGIVVVEGHR